LHRTLNVVNTRIEIAELTGSILADGDEQARKNYSRAWLASLAVLGIPIWLASPATLPILAGLGVGGKAALTFSMVLCSLAIHGLGKTIHGRPAWLAHLAFFAAAEMILLKGTSADLFALGLIALALAMSLRRLRRSNFTSTLSVAVLGLVVAWIHVPGFILLFLTLAILIAGEAVRTGCVLRVHVLALSPLLFGSIAACYAPSGAGLGMSRATLLSSSAFINVVILICGIAGAFVASHAVEMRAFARLLMAAAAILVLSLLGVFDLNIGAALAAILALIAFQITISRRHGAAALGLFGIVLLVRWFAALIMPQ
jgi:hypothetical protein